MILSFLVELIKVWISSFPVLCNLWVTSIVWSNCTPFQSECVFVVIETLLWTWNQCKREYMCHESRKTTKKNEQLGSIIEVHARLQAPCCCVGGCKCLVLYLYKDIALKCMILPKPRICSTKHISSVHTCVKQYIVYISRRKYKISMSMA